MKLIAVLLLSFPVLLSAQNRVPDYEATRLSDTVHMISGSGGNVGVSAGSDGIYIIDDQVAPLIEHLTAAISDIAEGPIRFVINTHYHGDHVGGNEAVGKGGAVIISHDNLHKRMSTEQFSHFFGETTPAFPSDALPVHVPNGHTDGDSIVHFTGSNVIHMGDIWFHHWYPFIDLDAGGSMQGTLKGVELALALADDETKIIPGHGKLGNKADLLEYRDFLIKATANVQTLMDQGLSLEAIVAAKPNAEWDDAFGNIFITPEQFVVFIYNSIKGIDHYTAPARE
jgi:glyoxylase-like metal-dependent hydrolase (beta-lactamase superfamily II)